ncbi:MAG: TIGR02147 family protein [Bdellovibrionales bacterium]
MRGSVVSKYVRPDVFSYHDIHQFLTDHFDYARMADRHFSLRKLAERADLSTGLLPGILARKITLSKQTLSKLSEHLDLSKPELQFLEWLRQLSESPTLEEKHRAYKNICRYQKFQKKNRTEIEVHHYLQKWYYPVIRELVKLPTFQLSPEWIRKQLGGQIKLSEARDALNFLLKNGYVQIDESGRTILPQKQITAAGGAYKLAMAEYYRQILDLAHRSIYDTTSDNRELNVHTFAFAQKDFHQVKTLFSETLQKLRTLQVEERDKDSVYQVTLLAFPVAQNKESAES